MWDNRYPESIFIVFNPQVDTTWLLFFIMIYPQRYYTPPAIPNQATCFRENEPVANEIKNLMVVYLLVAWNNSNATWRKKTPIQRNYILFKTSRSLTDRSVAFGALSVVPYYNCQVVTACLENWWVLIISRVVSHIPTRELALYALL